MRNLIFIFILSYILFFYVGCHNERKKLNKQKNISEYVLNNVFPVMAYTDSPRNSELFLAFVYDPAHAYYYNINRDTLIDSSVLARKKTLAMWNYAKELDDDILWTFIGGTTTAAVTLQQVVKSKSALKKDKTLAIVLGFISGYESGKWFARANARDLSDSLEPYLTNEANWKKIEKEYCLEFCLRNDEIFRAAASKDSLLADGNRKNKIIYNLIKKDFINSPILNTLLVIRNGLPEKIKKETASKTDWDNVIAIIAISIALSIFIGFIIFLIFMNRKKHKALMNNNGTSDNISKIILPSEDEVIKFSKKR